MEQVQTAVDDPNEENSEAVERQKRYEALRAQLWTGRQATYEQQDKAILTLSSGGLAASIAFIKDIVPLHQSTHLWCLLTSWAFFVLAIALILGSYVTSQKAHDRQLDNLDKYLAGEDDALEDKYNAYVPWTHRLNSAALCAFFLALLTSVIFVGVNVVAQSTNNTSNHIPDSEQKGLPPPKISAPQPQQRIVQPSSAPKEPSPKK